MSKLLPPPPPDSLPEPPGFNRRSKYQRQPGLVSLWGLLIGLAIGLGIGLFISWVAFPVIETDTRPAQLNAEDKAHYLIAISLAFAYDGDLSQAIERLTDLNLGPNPLQSSAEIACDLARTGYVDSSAGLRGVRSLRTFYQLQGRSGCADTLIPDVEQPQVVQIDVPTPTATLPPPPTKTPAENISSSPTPPGVRIVPTTPPQRQYDGRVAATFCDVQRSGLIEIFVQNGGGQGIPGERLRVEWDDGESLVVSGLKPERGAAYADFEMEAGKSYVVSMPGLSDPVSSPLLADSCITESGEEAITSYRVVFVRGG